MNAIWFQQFVSNIFVCLCFIVSSIFSSRGISFDLSSVEFCHMLNFDISSSVSLLTEMGEIFAGDFFFLLVSGFLQLFFRFQRVPFAMILSVQFIAFVYPCYLVYFSQRHGSSVCSFLKLLNGAVLNMSVTHLGPAQVPMMSPNGSVPTIYVPPGYAPQVCHFTCLFYFFSCKFWNWNHNR